MRGKEFPQKKVLSLVLCVAVMLSVMVMGAGAVFSDQDKIENTEAVDACSALNIIGGYPDGSYKPEGNIKRSETVSYTHLDVYKRQALFSLMTEAPPILPLLSVAPSPTTAPMLFFASALANCFSS